MVPELPQDYSNFEESKEPHFMTDAYSKFDKLSSNLAKNQNVSSDCKPE